MKLNDIQSLRKKHPLGSHDESLKAITHLDPKESIPVIVRMIEEVNAALEEYELCSMPDKLQPQKGNLYVKKVGSVLHYTVINPSGEVVTGVITKKELEIKSFELNELKSQLPSILKITTARGHTAAIDPSLIVTRNVTVEAIRILKETDEKQNANILRIPIILANVTKKQIEGDSQGLVDGVSRQEFKITERTKSLWQEVALWLEGLYCHTDILYVKREIDGTPQQEPDGTIKTVDKLDGLFKSLIGLTKWQVAIYYHKTALVLEQKLQDYNQATLQQVVSQQLSAALASASPQAQPVRSVENTIQLEDDGGPYITIRVPRSLAERAEQIVGELETPPRPSSFSSDSQPPLDGNELPDILLAVKDHDLVGQIRALEYALDCAWTSHQAKVLERFCSEIDANLVVYINSRWSLLGLYTLPRAHETLAEDTRENLAHTTDPKLHLECIIKAREILIQERSKDLLPRINKLLLDAIQMLRDLRPVSPVKRCSRLFEQPAPSAAEVIPPTRTTTVARLTPS